LEKHVKEHQCSDLQAVRPHTHGESGSSHILAMAALDVILVANDDRRYLDVNDAAAAVMGLSRLEIVGRQVYEFFPEVRGKSSSSRLGGFHCRGSSTWHLRDDSRRQFEYHAKANFAPRFSPLGLA